MNKKYELSNIETDICFEYEDNVLRYVAEKLIKSGQARNDTSDSKGHLEYNAISQVLSYFSDLYYRHVYIKEEDRISCMEYVEKRFKIQHTLHIAYSGGVLPSGFMPSLIAEINEQIKNLKLAMSMNPDNKKVA